MLFVMESWVQLETSVVEQKAEGTSLIENRRFNKFVQNFILSIMVGYMLLFYFVLVLIAIS